MRIGVRVFVLVSTSTWCLHCSPKAAVGLGEKGVWAGLFSPIPRPEDFSSLELPMDNISADNVGVCLLGKKKLLVFLAAL